MARLKSCAIKAVGGLAVGVASDEVHQDGRINRLKREHCSAPARMSSFPIIAIFGTCSNCLAPAPQPLASEP